MTPITRKISILFFLLAVLSLSSTLGYAIINVPGAIPASGCRTGALMSLDAFTTTGFSQVRTVNAGEEAPAGMWAIVDDSVPSTGVVATPNCPSPAPDMHPLRVVALRVTPTIGSWQSADIQEIKLVLDNNCNGEWENGIDFTFQTKSGTELQTTGAILFVNGPQSPLFTVGPAFGGPSMCGMGAIGVMAVVTIGNNPTSGAQFGLSMEALSVDIPGLGPTGPSSGFSSSQNNQGSSIRLQILGSGSGTPPPPPPGGGGGGGGGGTFSSYDSNGNCALDDNEFFSVLDDWLQEAVSNDFFFDGVDYWIGQNNICATAAGIETLSLNNIALTQNANQVTFRAQGQHIASTAVEIYGLNGESIFVGESAGTRLSWNLRSHDGSALANGVYLYRMTVRGVDGSILNSAMNKIVVMR